MHKKIIIFLSILLISFSSVFSQRKVGTTDSYIFNLCPSVKSSGMGETGVAQVHEKSFSINPGSLGLYAFNNKLILSSSLNEAIYKDLYFFDNRSITFPLHISSNKNPKCLFAVGYADSETLFKEILEETTYEYPNGTGRFYRPKFTNKNIVVSFGYNSNVQIGVGFTLKFINASIFDYSIDKEGYDLGFIIRYPILPDLSNSREKIYFIPSFGFSSTNNDFSETSEYIFNSTLPHKKSMGFSFEFGLWGNINGVSSTSVFSILPSYDISQIIADSWENQHGIELGLFESIYFRFGNNDRMGKSTGFSISSHGLFSLLQTKSSNKETRLGSSMSSPELMVLEYSFASSDELKSIHEIIFKFQF